MVERSKPECVAKQTAGKHVHGIATVEGRCCVRTTVASNRRGAETGVTVLSRSFCHFIFELIELRELFVWRVKSKNIK